MLFDLAPESSPAKDWSPNGRFFRLASSVEYETLLETWPSLLRSPLSRPHVKCLGGLVTGHKAHKHSHCAPFLMVWRRMVWVDDLNFISFENIIYAFDGMGDISWVSVETFPRRMTGLA